MVRMRVTETRGIVGEGSVEVKVILGKELKVLEGLVRVRVGCSGYVVVVLRQEKVVVEGKVWRHVTLDRLVGNSL